MKKIREMIPNIKNIFDKYDSFNQMNDMIFKKDSTFIENNKWDIRFLNLAKHISKWSKDPSTKVGAVIVDKNNRVISVGYNGFAKSINDNDLQNRELKYEKTIHAEMNCLLFANTSLVGFKIYVYPLPPCARCMTMLIQAGISEIITCELKGDLKERWNDSYNIAFDMAKEANICVRFIDIGKIE